MVLIAYCVKFVGRVLSTAACFSTHNLLTACICRCAEHARTGTPSLFVETNVCMAASCMLSCRHEVADHTVRVTCLSGHAQLLLDGATVAVKVPMSTSNHTLACGLVILHHTLQTDIADVSASPVTWVLLAL